MIYDCIIIGAGASGLFCSSAFEHKVKGLILEKTKRPGTKLLMSGSGMCNITHDGSIKDFVPKYGKNGGKIRSCLYKYNNLHLMDFLRQNGIETVTREDGKVFPKSMMSKDVLDMLMAKTEANGFSVKYNSEVVSIQPVDSFYDVKTADDRTYRTGQLIIACGGASYPATGSDGKLFSVLSRDLQLKITPLVPALSSIGVKNYPYSSLSGISFRDAHLSIWHSDKKIAENTGDLLLTHRDFSGPLIINFSKYIKENSKITLNYIYPCDKQTALERIKNAVQVSDKNMLNTLTKEFQLPKNFMDFLLKKTGGKQKELATHLTEDSFFARGPGSFDCAMATCGGVSMTELNCKTMECKNHPGVFVIGEACDIDGETGGYNLQFAYSSARAVVQTVSERLNHSKDKGDE